MSTACDHDDAVKHVLLSDDDVTVVDAAERLAREPNGPPFEGALAEIMRAYWKGQLKLYHLDRPRWQNEGREVNQSDHSFPRHVGEGQLVELVETADEDSPRTPVLERERTEEPREVLLAWIGKMAKTGLTGFVNTGWKPGPATWDAMARAHPRDYDPNLVYLREFWVSKSEVMRLLSGSAGITSSSPALSSVDVGSGQASDDHSGDILGPRNAPRKAASPAKVRKWYEKRVQNWPKVIQHLHRQMS